MSVKVWALVCVYTTVPSAAPQHISVSASSPRSAVVRWRGPPLDDQNGRIVHYVVRYFPADDRSLVREEEVEAPESQYDVIEHVVDQLQPYTTYKFVVAAATAAGQGPFSNPSSIRMPQDSKLCINLCDDHSADQLHRSNYIYNSCHYVGLLINCI